MTQIQHYIYLLASLLLVGACHPNKSQNSETVEEVFPFLIPAEKPNRPLSAALERNYEA